MSEPTSPREPGASPASKTPRQRTWRTVAQVIVGVAAAVPAAMGDWSNSAVLGIAGAVVVLVSAGMNAYDQATGRG